MNWQSCKNYSKSTVVNDANKTIIIPYKVIYVKTLKKKKWTNWNESIDLRVDYSKCKRVKQSMVKCRKVGFWVYRQLRKYYHQYVYSHRSTDRLRTAQHRARGAVSSAAFSAIVDSWHQQAGAPGIGYRLCWPIINIRKQCLKTKSQFNLQIKLQFVYHFFYVLFIFFTKVICVFLQKHKNPLLYKIITQSNGNGTDAIIVVRAIRIEIVATPADTANKALEGCRANVYCVFLSIK